MANFAKGIVCLLIVAVAAPGAFGSDFGITESSGRECGQLKEEVVVWQTQTLVVPSCKFAVPILIKCDDYEGPYDPTDPDGKRAARARKAFMRQKSVKDEIHSYIPPGFKEFMAKEAKSTALHLGSKIARENVKETTKLGGVAIATKNLVDTVKDHVKDYEEDVEKKKQKEEEEAKERAEKEEKRRQREERKGRNKN